MTKENMFKSFLEDPIFIDGRHYTREQIDKFKFIDTTNDKLIEVVKIAISGNIDGESESAISRRINQFLNR